MSDASRQPHGTVHAGAPPVVVVMVTRAPGEWLEESLGALAGLDYPNLSVLVVDAGDDPQLTARVAGVLPHAYVRRVDGSHGYAAAADDVLAVVEGASYFLFCHDDVAPAPDAVRVLVEEAFRSNAGIVGPKLVEWSRPQRLLAVGVGVDKLAAVSPLVEPGELDQEQHDAVRDVFASPGACLLVRADLFTSLGGFAPAITGPGEDIDLCWRAQVAGARVVVAPEARVRHLEASRHGQRDGGDSPEQRSRMAARYRLRTVLTCYGIVHLLRVLPQAALLGVAELIWAGLTGNGERARSVVGAWSWNLRRLGDLRAARRSVHRQRAMRDREVRRLQARGSARIAGFVRTQLNDDRDGGRSVASVGRDLAGSFRQGSLRLPVAVWTAIVVILVFGSRQLLTGAVPAVGQLAPFPGGPGSLLREFGSGWRSSGLGSSGAAPFAFALLGLAGTVLVGAMGLLRQILILGCIPVGAAGAYRFARPLESRRARLAATIVYLAVPVAYDALARGRWSGLLVYAAAPFLLRRLAEATGLAPFARDRSSAGRKLLAPVAPLAILTALTAAFVPSVLALLPLLAGGLLLGSVLAGSVRAALRALAVAVLSALGAAALLFPWTFQVLGREWAVFTGVAGPERRALSLGDVLRFHTGFLGSAPLGWAFLVVAALPLLIGKAWRLDWAIRLWSVAVVCWAGTWASSRGWLGFPLASPEVLLAPAAVALALCAALGAASFEADLPGYSFGWRQAASLAALGAVVLGALPVVGAAADGRWHLPQQDDAHLLAWMPLQREAGDFRVLWVGDPGVLPLDGWRLSDGLAYAVSRGGTPDVSALWPGPSSGPTHLLADALAVARRGQTTRLGHLLAPMAVRYIALPVRLAPGTQRDPASPLPGDLDAALRSQLDLKEVESDPAVRVYENVSWAPARSLVPPAAAGALTARRADASTDVELAGSTPVLEGSDGPNSFSGSVSGPGSLYLSEAASPGWQLHAGGHRQLRQTAFGWANVFEVDGGGPASLAYATPLSRYAAIAIELALWALAIREIIRRRRRRRLVDVTVAAAGDVVEAQSIDAMEAAVVGAAGLAASRGGR